MTYFSELHGQKQCTTKWKFLNVLFFKKKIATTEQLGGIWKTMED